MKELWHGRSAREQSAKNVGRGMWRSVNELILVRCVVLLRKYPNHLKLMMLLCRNIKLDVEEFDFILLSNSRKLHIYIRQL